MLCSHLYGIWDLVIFVAYTLSMQSHCILLFFGGIAVSSFWYPLTGLWLLVYLCTYFWMSLKSDAFDFLPLFENFFLYCYVLGISVWGPASVWTFCTSSLRVFLIFDLDVCSLYIHIYTSDNFFVECCILTFVSHKIFHMFFFEYLLLYFCVLAISVCGLCCFRSLGISFLLYFSC